MTSKYVGDLFKDLVLDPHDKDLQAFWAASVAHQRAAQLANSLHFFSELAELGVMLSKAGAYDTAETALKSAAHYKSKRAKLIHIAWGFETEARNAAVKVLKADRRFEDSEWEDVRSALRARIAEMSATDMHFKEIFKVNRSK